MQYNTLLATARKTHTIAEIAKNYKRPLFIFDYLTTSESFWLLEIWAYGNISLPAEAHDKVR